MVRNIRGKEYNEYLVKWKGRAVEDATWISPVEMESLHLTQDDIVADLQQQYH